MPPKTAVIPHIGRKIERIRKLKGIKQDDLADKLASVKVLYLNSNSLQPLTVQN